MRVRDPVYYSLRELTVNISSLSDSRSRFLLMSARADSCAASPPLPVAVGAIAKQSAHTQATSCSRNMLNFKRSTSEHTRRVLLLAQKLDCRREVRLMHSNWMNADLDGRRP